LAANRRLTPRRPGFCQHWQLASKPPAGIVDRGVVDWEYDLVRIDLHTHSAVSDGTDSPAELIRAAGDAGLDVVALTDHDAVAGWAAAQQAARDLGIEFVPGTEISTKLHGTGLHLLAYWFDPNHPALKDVLTDIRLHRGRRIERIVNALVAAGIPLTVDEVFAEAEPADAVGRPHVADALVRKGIVADRDEAFNIWLSEGRPGNVRKHAPDVHQVIELVQDAGGVSVLAHPWGRTSRSVLTPEVIGELRAVGLAGLEVDHEDHDPPTRAALRALAVDLDLIVTGSSDYHGSGKTDHPLGCNTTEPAQYDQLRLHVATPSHEASAPGGQRP
jgi:3',5'-nucleoside bisphosphate phosphatase